MRFNKVLIFGCGVIGSNVLDLLSRAPETFDITVVGRNENLLRERVNLAITVAMNTSRVPRIRYRTGDLTDIDRTAELISEEKPDIIINATSLQTFWLISTLPQDKYQALQNAYIAPWLPNHIALARKLMLAVRDSGVDCRVVNASFPDAVNPVLAKVGLAPFIGAGNVANTIPTIKRAAALKLGRPVEAISVRFYAHHYVGNRIASTGDSGDAPFILAIFCDGVQVTDQLSTADLFRLFASQLKRTRGVTGQIVAASSVAAITRAIALDAGELLHAPGPNGLPGGYPVRVGAHKVEVICDVASLEEAIAVNEQGQVFEGIERIDDDGTVHFVEENMNVLKNTLGYHKQSMAIDEIEDCAVELQERYRAYAEDLRISA